jgi:hypothetical protein
MTSSACLLLLCIAAFLNRSIGSDERGLMYMDNDGNIHVNAPSTKDVYINDASIGKFHSNSFNDLEAVEASNAMLTPYSHA